ncbi:colicin E3-like toxin immunity protein [Pseudomonas sp. R11F]|uniref:colicin E3-like toxin immunity protein n=1 Tax=Pseudomonas TaxID=286 RepID=UPI0013750086|nr:MULTISPECIES: colicin E3-like toxin immunity protein [Pseudomonas]NCE87829.1 cloacin [Pseudomonas sp. Q1]UOP12117.1 cloacin immunity family protein [Pseudomonas palleroniana]
MVMKIRLEWFDKQTENLEADEYSANLDEDDGILKALDLHDEPEIYAGGFDVLPDWIAILQPHFRHVIEPSRFDYQISFRYQGAWPPPPKQPKKAS